MVASHLPRGLLLAIREPSSAISWCSKRIWGANRVTVAWIGLWRKKGPAIIGLSRFICNLRFRRTTERPRNSSMSKHRVSAFRVFKLKYRKPNRSPNREGRRYQWVKSQLRTARLVLLTRKYWEAISNHRSSSTPLIALMDFFKVNINAWKHIKSKTLNRNKCSSNTNGRVSLSITSNSESNKLHK